MKPSNHTSAEAAIKLRERLARAALMKISKEELVNQIIRGNAFSIQSEDANNQIIADLNKERASHAKATKRIAELMRSLKERDEAFDELRTSLLGYNAIPADNEIHVTYPGGMIVSFPASEFDKHLDINTLSEKVPDFQIGVSVANLHHSCTWSRLKKLEKDTAHFKTPFDVGRLLDSLGSEAIDGETFEACIDSLWAEKSEDALEIESTTIHASSEGAPSVEELLADDKIRETVEEASQFVFGRELADTGKMTVPMIIVAYTLTPDKPEMSSQIATICSLISASRTITTRFGETFIAVFRSKGELETFAALCSKYGIDPETVARFVSAYLE